MTSALHIVNDSDGTSFSDLAREVLAANLDVYSVQELADKVFDATPESLIPTFYWEILPQALSVVIARTRNAKPVTQEPRKGGGGSSRMRQISKSAWYEKRMDARIKTDDGMVPFRRCTIKQIDAYAAYVVDKGNATVENGLKYRKLALIGFDRGYQTGEDFPEDVLKDILG